MNQLDDLSQERDYRKFLTLFLKLFNVPALLHALKWATCITIVSSWAIADTQSRNSPVLQKLGQEWQNLSDSLGNQPTQVVEKALSKVQNISDPIQKAQAHLVLSRAYYILVFPDKSLSHAQQGLELIQERTQPWLFHSLALAKANAFDIGANAAPGLALAESALDWASKNENHNMLTEAHSTLGLLYLTLGLYNDALERLLSAYTLSKDHQTEISTGDIANSIAIVFDYRREYSQAIQYYKESLEYHRQDDNPLAISISLYGLGKSLRNLGNLNKALVHLKEAEQISIELNDQQGIAFAHNEMAEIYLQQNQYDRAQKLFRSAADIFSEANNKDMQVSSYSGLAEVAIRQSKWELAKSHLQRAKSLTSEDSMPTQRINLDRKLAQVHAMLKDFEMAFTLLLGSYEAKDLFSRRQNTLQLQTLQTQFDVEQKEAANNYLQQQNKIQKQLLAASQQRRGLLGLVTILLMLICILFVILYRKSLKHAERLENIANTDSLTGLLTRRYTFDLISQQIELANRHNNPLSVAIIDLDLFKKINDTFGHQVGDLVLMSFGKLALSEFRQSDIIGRVGGEEFLLAFPHTYSDTALVKLKRFQDKVKNIPDVIKVKGLSVTISIGIVEHHAGHDTQSLFALADEALYQAKNNGRNRIVHKKVDSI